MKDLTKASILGVAAFAPFLAFAQTLGGVLTIAGNLIATATPIVVALALVYFFWGLANYILSSGDDKKKEAINVMIYGIIALFVMVSVWGIINVLQDTFSVGGTQQITPPSVNGI